MKKTHVFMASVVMISVAALPGVSRGTGYNDPDNLLLNKTINAQHAWYGSGGLGVLVDNSPGSWYQFAGLAWNGVYWEYDNYTPDPDMRVSVSGFDSPVGTVRYWGSAYALPSGNRALNGVTIYRSSASTTSLDPVDYVSGVHFVIPLETNPGNPMPEGWGSAAEGSYYDFAYSAPAGTQSLLFMFENAGIAGNFANEIYKLQAFAPVQAQFHPGDANGDGVVDLQDFGLLKDNFGLTEGATWGQGDFTGDGLIDLQDFGVLKDHFGHTTGDNPVIPMSIGIPEPGTLSLLALAGLAIRRKR
jgi:hypothetical protein